MSIQWHWTTTMSFSERLASVRKSRDMTQAQLAEATSIHLSQIKRYEAGYAQPSLDVLRKFARSLHISADLLLFDDEERGPDDELRLQFEALSQFSPEEKQVAKAVIEGLILKHDSQRFNRAS